MNAVVLLQKCVENLCVIHETVKSRNFHCVSHILLLLTVYANGLNRKKLQKHTRTGTLTFRYILDGNKILIVEYLKFKYSKVWKDTRVVYA